MPRLTNYTVTSRDSGGPTSMMSPSLKAVYPACDGRITDVAHGEPPKDAFPREADCEVTAAAAVVPQLAAIHRAQPSPSFPLLWLSLPVSCGSCQKNSPRPTTPPPQKFGPLVGCFFWVSEAPEAPKTLRTISQLAPGQNLRFGQSRGTSKKVRPHHHRIANQPGRHPQPISPTRGNTVKMRYIHSEETLEVPEGVSVQIKARKVTVTGPRGKLTKDLSHLAVNFSHPKKNVIGIEIHHGARKNVAALRTVRTLINNLIVGVTKGFKYKMRYVYAHFPINVNIDKNSETDQYEVEIRNFIGEKLVRRVVMRHGVDVKVSSAQKDELILEGNSLEDVSQSAADIQQICKVRNKDIRKVS
ncbi:uncharacterized protein JN550_013892 [Neoarthrinium moseri]|uniref:uncharacterized protein n=1 Tax=Neoarthrinium moseri TaxID=1658444 RepID=UPI001FDB65E9|nr:uncharacterized protein JN550_013892 [Neoarthrinium moseri]KAI1856189.1 hypothetical protein JN550_013892 [Neoarthrinium moseri]